ncbi:ATP-binding cassette domain-containing protein [Dyella terrae]|nr:ATP-binding cassette domain-containing protein [Dyella terrae]
MSVGDATVVAKGLRKVFAGPGGKPVRALDGVSLSIRSGELTALVGPDGAGKTTLLRMLVGILAPDEGEL